MKICVLGAGTWGCALASLLTKNGHEVKLWSAIGAELDALRITGEHPKLPGAIMPVGIEYTEDIGYAIGGCAAVLFVVPSEFIRATAARAAEYILPEMILINAAKGIEAATLMPMTEVIRDELIKCRGSNDYRIVALSGPTHAEEVAIGLPTSIVSACEDTETSLEVAYMFRNSCMRVYTNTDVVGVELCGAMKNIIAIAAGINRGVEFGDNAAAMLMTRGIAEIMRLGVAMGARRETFIGLAGIGDLIVTATSRHSRNHRCGVLIGQGKSYEEAKAEIGMVIEGYHALTAAIRLSDKYGIELPITRAVYDVMINGKAPYPVIRELMSRDIKDETVMY